MQLSSWTAQLLLLPHIVVRGVRCFPSYQCYRSVIKEATTTVFAKYQRPIRIDRGNVWNGRHSLLNLFSDKDAGLVPCQKSDLFIEKHDEKQPFLQIPGDGSQDLLRFPPFSCIVSHLVNRSSFLRACFLPCSIALLAKPSFASITVSFDQEQELLLKRPTEDQPQILFPDASRMSKRPMETTLEGMCNRDSSIFK
jgi:hypothetical protein